MESPVPPASPRSERAVPRHLVLRPVSTPDGGPSQEYGGSSSTIFSHPVWRASWASLEPVAKAYYVLSGHRSIATLCVHYRAPTPTVEFSGGELNDFNTLGSGTSDVEWLELLGLLLIELGPYNLCASALSPRTATSCAAALASIGADLAVSVVDSPEIDLRSWHLSRAMERKTSYAVRRLNAVGPVTHQTITEPAAVREAIHSLCQQRLESWVARDRPVTDLLETQLHIDFQQVLASLCERLATERRASVQQISCADVLVAADLWFYGETDGLLYMRSYHPQYARMSPGHVLLALTLTSFEFSRLIRVFFGRGAEAYKFAFGATNYPLYTLIASVA